MHTAAQSVHEYVWHVKWDQGERNGQVGRSNSHPPDHESCLMSGLPTRWCACKLPHCAIDSDVAFWYNYLSPAWIYPGEKRGILSLGNARQGMSLGVGLLKKIVAGKKKFIGRSYENCHFQCRNLAVHLLLRRWHSNSTWNQFHVFIYKRLFSFCYRWGMLFTPNFFQFNI